MTIGQLTLFATCLFGLGVFTTVRGVITHYKVRLAIQDRKKNKLPEEKTISILMLIAWTGATYLEDQLINKLELPLPEWFIDIGKAMSVGLAIAFVLLVMNHFRKTSKERDERMLFLECGFLIMLSYLIISPALMMIYLRLTIS